MLDFMLDFRLRRAPRRVQTGPFYLSADHCGHTDPDYREYAWGTWEEDQYVEDRTTYDELHEEDESVDGGLVCLDCIPGLAIYDLQGQWIRTLKNPQKRG